ncbi:NUDIX domain-containing protein [Actinomadura rupiterrae]|uniref:NUDIX domain-containing protein n=1 Tax=Actinomadura rupiterrae TaxID=559627 RepID=UPI0020A5FE18|nr:NUDIX domain-containing protein [Actinomadura rupiterrae]MCP2336440.1 8-oxo-dGTP pyrophosphatase MutT (NUDIX family) [Actinomadura rupiterrae]
MRRSILIQDDEVSKNLGLVLICSGYLVEQGRVLLVHHNRFDKWVPPGGHIEPGETFAETAVREFKEETGLLVEALSSQPGIHPPDDNATPEPVPFYADLEREGFATPALVQFFYVRRAAASHGQELAAELSEVHDARWFGLAELDDLKTFEQVRSLARFALGNYPIESERA